MHENQNYYRYVNRCVEFILKATSRNQKVFLWFKENEELWNWLFVWLENRRAAPAG